MPFGKRVLPPVKPAHDMAAMAKASPVSMSSVPSTVSSPVELPALARHQALREILLRILADAGQVANAIKANGSFALTGVADIIDPLTAPIEIRDLQEHFTFQEDGLVVHPFFAYAAPETPDQPDPRAQFQLYEMVLAIRRLNVYCQEAQQNEALGVALQSPSLPVLIDQILVSASFFAAYFDNLAITHPFIPKMIATGQVYPGFDQLRLTLDRHRLMATDRMVVPETFDAMLPNAMWPHLGVEIVRRQEGGESMVHGIYFPAEYARKLAASKVERPRSETLLAMR